MMNILVILGHPDPNSFNQALARTAREELERLGGRVVFHDLAAEGFDPVLPVDEIPTDAVLPPDIARPLRGTGGCGRSGDYSSQLVGHAPGRAQGLDRPGGALRGGLRVRGDRSGGEGVPIRLLTKLKSVVVLNTGNTPLERELAVFGDPLERVWLNCVFGLCAKADFHRRYFTVVCESSLEQRQGWLEEVRQTMREVFRGTGAVQVTT